MKTFALASALLVTLVTASTASAQYVVPYNTYYAPAVAPAYYAAPVVVRPRRAYYAPAPVVAALVYAQPVVVARYGRSIYCTRQVYYPGQPVLNTVRAVTP
mgnify:CR=1 FL=1